ncbi:LysR family transcriptional regulator [Levilactobacillus yiduensis]|uniref:LysR family transcriptional regulator n=1 Tax=Levilactobacillus yiduensis TaxID=2953880 RepID=UPI000EF2E22A|nr:LysR family transcriptional regulator [Levilactobacillus yiduensis]AYM02027.1 LysR family transcriptional regulator [Levilactobacillus brevis]
MDLTTCQYFVDVVDLANFTKAAERNFISQPAMSAQIKQLEETVGKPLLVRDHHHVTVTPAGQRFYRAAQQMLATYHGAMRDIWHEQSQSPAKLRVSFYIAQQFQPYIDQLVRFRTDFPNISVDLVERDSEQAVQDILTDQADLGFGIVDHSERRLTWKQELADRLVVVASPPTMATVPRAVTLDDLAALTYVTLAQVPATQFEQLTRNLLAGHAFRVEKLPTLDVLFTRLQMTASFALLPESQVPPSLTGLTTRPLKTSQPNTMAVGWCYRRHPLDPVVGAFLAYANLL